MVKNGQATLAGFILVAAVIAVGIVLLEKRIMSEAEKINHSITNLPINFIQSLRT
jgi:hypothetical protein